MSVREQWKGAKPGAEGDARASHILPTRTPFLQGYPNTTGWDRSLMALHMASSDLNPGRRWGWRQALLYYPLGRGLMLRPELKWSRGICMGGGVPGEATLGIWSSLACSGLWQLRSLQKVCNPLLVKGVLTSNVLKLYSSFWTSARFIKGFQ